MNMIEQFSLENMKSAILAIFFKLLKLHYTSGDLVSGTITIAKLFCD